MLYLDTSALVKKYIEETGSADVRHWISEHESIATATIARVEAAATFARAARRGSLTEAAAQSAHRVFARDWHNYIRIRVTESLLARAENAAWTFRLRGYDAVHLAAAIEWRDRMGVVVTVATFDEDLRAAAGQAGLDCLPQLARN